ncbi:ubiquitin-like protein 7 isoform X2 [Planococcus citri]|uniref:ubiquitin-like protein 7 isoform X2 n=1 Tax=Planococcus citri TaxID=170843 RepID=UPI0031F9FE0D
MYLNLGVCMLLKDFKITRVENVNFDSTVEDFKTKVAEEVNFLKENIELVFSGLPLSDSSTLKDCGLREGYVVHVFQKKEKEAAPPPLTVPESDFLDLVHVFRVLSTRNAYRRVLQKLNKPEVLENIISTTPGLREDSTALVILQHPELLAKLGDSNAVRKVIEEHPTLASAARNLVAAVQNDMLTSSSASASSSVNNSSNNVSFVVGSDDEEMEGLERGSENEDAEHPVNVITTSQVAAALANTNVRANPGSASSSITPEMMSAAVQQAIASTSSRPTSTPTPTPEANTDSVVTITKLEELRKLGFVNDAVNIQALQLSNGDLEAAVNLILSGLMNDES